MTSRLLTLLLAMFLTVGGMASAGTVNSATAPVVSAGIIGKQRTMFAPRLVTARATTVKVGRKNCAVAAGTPLAALAALRRIGGPKFSLRDYGTCGRKSKNSGSLFVTKIGSLKNRGQDGWVYSVAGKVGTTGAADPSGPFGSGLIKAGAKVRWYWCDMDKDKSC